MSEGLDPRDWEALRELGRRMLDDTLGHLETVRERPAWNPVSREVRERLDRPVPRKGSSPEEVYREFEELVRPHNYGSIHPRFWGWVNGSGTPFGVLAEMLGAGLHVNAHGTDTSSYYVERQVVEWLRQLFGMPEGTSGLLLSGASMANFLGLAIGLQSRAPVDFAAAGLRAQPGDLLVYAAETVHSSVAKATRLLGLGERNLRRVPVGPDFALDQGRLSAAISADRRAGAIPVAVVASAGTVDTGAVDPLRDIAALCRAEGLWFHVDGAIGAVAALSARMRPLLAGMEEADSLAFDLHKWLHMPYGTGGLLVRESALHRAPFETRAPYLTRLPGGLSDVDEPFNHYGLELTRGFRALAVWMGLLHYGAEAFAAVVEDNVAQANHLAELVEAHDELELLAPVSLNIVCFRHRPAGLGEDATHAHNQALLVELQRDGVAVPSHTWIGGKFAIRVSITNHRSRHDDFDLLVSEVVRRGRALREAALA